MPISPTRPCAWPAIACTACLSLMSPAIACAIPPRERIVATASASGPASRATIATRAPWAASASASARPSPRLAPVTSAPVPWIFMTFLLRSVLRMPRQSVTGRANLLAGGHCVSGEHDHLADNIKALRETRGLSQQQMAKAAGIPRATWTHLESGAANPTLAVLIKVANALQVRLDELLAAPRQPARL